MLENYAERVRFVRSLTKLSREAFEERYGINKNTLKSWELGVNTLTEKSAKTVAEAIQNEGYSCSAEWLIFGLGSEPRPLSQTEDEELLAEVDQQSKVIYEADYFKRNNTNSVVYMITDGSMYPNYKIGDYVGGIKEEPIIKINYFVGYSCIITLLDEIVLVRNCLLGKNDCIILCPLNTQYQADIVKIDDITSIASIVWHRSTYTRHTNES